MKKETMWKCEVGVVGHMPLTPGSDLPMRRAIERAFKDLTGRDPEFIFSGWGSELTDVQRDIVETNPKTTDGAHLVGFNKGGTA